MRPSHILTLLAFLLAAGAGRPAHADRFELSLGTTIHSAQSASVHALHDGGSAGFSLSGAMGVMQAAGLDIAIDAALETDSASGTTFQRMDTETSATLILVGARARRPVTGSLIAHGRAALGMGRVSVDMSDPYGAWPMRDSGYAGSAYVGAGLDFLPLRPPIRGGNRPLSLGIRLEVGYLLMTPVELTTEPDDSGDNTLAIPVAGASLGDLDLSAITTRLAVVGRF